MGNSSKKSLASHRVLRVAYFTLLEVIISMALMVILLGTLLYFYQEVNTIGINIDQVQAESFQKRFLEKRLTDIISKSVSEKDEKKDFVFFTAPDEYGISKPGSQSLIFTFDNGANLDKVFSNHVLGRLYVDLNDRLMLAYWPSPKIWYGNDNPPMKKEILQEGVDSLKFDFFVPPDRKDPAAKKNEKKPAPSKQKNEPEEPPAVEPDPKGGWRPDTWSQNFQQLPAMVRITLKLKGSEKPIVFAVPLINVQKQVIYNE